MMKRLGRLHFLVGILVSVLLMAQAVIGIMMYVDGSGNEPMNRQAVMGQPADRNTTESDDTEESANSNTATDDSSTETATNDTQGNPQGSGTPGEMPSGGGFQGRDSFCWEIHRLLSRGRWLGRIHHHLCNWSRWISDNGDIKKNSCLNSRYYLRQEKVPFRRGAFFFNSRNPLLSLIVILKWEIIIALKKNISLI
ncbi:hypothetical protein RCO48_00700 [Peribacillus frigoritolerans]|nr:hypothetical protein [Peribacillus frigoritolerans]